MAVESMVETGVSFTRPGGQWSKHSIALDFDTVGSRLDAPATEKWEALNLAQQILLLRAIEEIMLCQFRRSRKDPDYIPGEEETWRKVIFKLIGEEGLGRLGV